jgi:hypothetical protein
MTPTIDVREPRSSDAGELAIRLRRHDLAELSSSSDASPEFVIQAGIEGARWAKAADVNGELAALFGVNPLAQEGAAHIGIPWLLSAPNIYDIGTLTFCKRALFWYEEMHKEFDHLVNVVMATNTKPITWLHWLGFEFTAVYPRYGRFKVPFLQFESVRS